MNFNLSSHSKRSSICALFPGQGSQSVGMGKDFYTQFPMARAVFEEASDVIHLDLKKLCFEDPDDQLILTENTQPCLLTTSIAIFRVLQHEFQWTPGAVAGHSLGEYSALVAIGSLELSQAILWVRARGLAMQEAVPMGEGSMAAILGLEDEIVNELCQTASDLAEKARLTAEKKTLLTLPALVESANFNAPGQIVIAGSMDALHEVTQLIQSHQKFSKGKIIALPVSAPFHSSHMRPAKEQMAKLFTTTPVHFKPKTPTCPYLPNRTAQFNQNPNLIFEFLIEQIDHPVLWKQSMTTLLNAEFSTVLELGPGKVLSGLFKRIALSLKKPYTTLAIQDPSPLKELEKLFAQPRPEN